MLPWILPRKEPTGGTKLPYREENSTDMLPRRANLGTAFARVGMALVLVKNSVPTLEFPYFHLYTVAKVASVFISVHVPCKSGLLLLYVCTVQ